MKLVIKLWELTTLCMIFQITPEYCGCSWLKQVNANECFVVGLHHLDRGYFTGSGWICWSIAKLEIFSFSGIKLFLFLQYYNIIIYGEGLKVGYPRLWKGLIMGEISTFEEKREPVSVKFWLVLFLYFERWLKWLKGLECQKFQMR